MAKIKDKSSSTFVGSAKGGTKSKKRTYKGKDYVNHIGTFTSSNGTSFSIEIWQTPEKYFKDTGCAFGYKIAEFSNNENNRR